MTRVDKQEFENTVNTYSDMMYRCALAYCGNKADAEDVVQDAFVRYLQRSPEFKGEAHKKAWLLRVTINLSKDLCKSFWRRNKSELDENTPSKNGELSECEIWSAVSQLPQKYRVIIELYYGEGLTIDEISRITKVKRSTVGDRLLRAKQLLKKLYEEESV